MLPLNPPNYKYCPFCARQLDVRQDDGHDRKWCSADQWTYYAHVPCSAGVLLEKDGKYLLVKRNREPYLGKWMFPAGFVAYGEHPEETAIRETREETGIEVVSVKLLRIWQVTDDPREPGHFAFFYRGVLGKESGKVSDTEENSEIGWFALGELPEMAWEGQKQAVADLIAGRL